MAQAKEIRGGKEGGTIRHEDLERDTRSGMQKTTDWLKIPTNLASFLLFLAILAGFAPAVADICLIVAGLLAWYGLTRKETAPLKLPVQARSLDEHERNPGNGKSMMANGIFLLGNDVKTGKEVWITNSDCRQHFLVMGTTGAGKALPLDAKVHTPTGWRIMGDLKVGDMVSTPDGRSAPIAGYYPQGELDIYTITFADGRTAEACPEHLWEVHHKHWSGKYKKGISRTGEAKPRLLRTKEIISLLENNKGKFSVRLPEAVEKPEQTVGIDPYLLGALIGDGNISSKILRLSTVDAHLTAAVGHELSKMGHELFQDDYSASCDYRIRNIDKKFGLSPLRSELRDLGLEGLHSYEKFIPAAYKEGSTGQRWAIIQGLMDTDGTADSRHGSLSFSTSSHRLAKDFQEVVWSLGGLATISQRIPSYTDKNGIKAGGRMSYTIAIRHPEPANFFTLPRKMALVDKPYQYSQSLKLGIKEIKLSRRAEAACILVDHPDHLFITDNYVVTHNTEALIGFAANAIAWGSGFLFCDGKGDVALFSKIYAMCRRFGREDDLLVLNYMTGNKDLGASGGVLMSNTLNPFATGSSDTLTQMVVGLMDDAGGDGAMWKGRATAMFTGVMRALSWLRDNQIIDLNVSEIRDHLQLKRIIDLSDHQKYPDMPQPIRKSIKSYLSSLPGYQEDKGYKQSQTTLDQHGYLEMQFTKILGSLADVYGHIFHTPYGEIDMADVVLNRRILVIMLPALEKASDEIANLGKIVVATLKGMMGGTLGSQVEGNWSTVVDNRPTNSPSPFIVILDEVGYYMVDGMDLMAAQARSLGFALFFAGQDINAMKRNNEKVFGSVQGNTNTKLIMRCEDPDTADMAVKAAGKVKVAVNASFLGKVGELGKKFMSDNDAKVDEIDRINPMDLKDQDEGEMHIIHKGWLVRAKAFYANPEGAVNKHKLNLRPNHFITVAKPDPDEIQSQQKLPEIVQKLADPAFAKMMRTDAANSVKNIDPDSEIGLMASTLKAVGESKRRKSNPVEIACIVLAKLMQVGQKKTDNYSKDVRKSVGLPDGSPTMPIEAENLSGNQQRPNGRPNSPRSGRPDGFAGNTADGRPIIPEEFLPPSEADFDSIIHKEKRPYRPTPMKDVKHGAEVGGRLYEMSDRLSANDSVMRTLAAMNFDEKEETKSSVNSAVEEALLMEDVEGYDEGPPISQHDIESTTSATHASLPDFQSDDDDDDDDVGEAEPDGTIDVFLSSLIDEEDD